MGLFGIFKKKKEENMNDNNNGINNTLTEMLDMIELTRVHITELSEQVKKYKPKPKTGRDKFINYIFHYIGTFYSWAGDDPSGFDCSGITIEGL